MNTFTTPKSLRALAYVPLAGLAMMRATVPGTAAEVSLNGHKFTLPAGFRIELAAGSDVIPRPVSASFDPEGRLYVTDSAGLNLPPSEQLKNPRSRILRLEDRDGDGRFETTRVFAENVMFPQGCLWHGGSVYVAGPPSIWKFTDTDGDGKADRREEWYQGKVLTGCANDVHGPYLGPEGMIYWTKGAFSRLDLKDGKGRAVNDRCAHIFRAWPDGSGFETVMSGGMDNPVEVTFTAEGEPVFISTFIDLSQPGRRDGLGHAVYGGVFGKINDVVDEPMVKRTGDLMPVLAQLGPAAACALTRYEGDGFGPAYRDNLFGTLFNLRKVTRHALKPKGAGYASDDSDFLVSDQIDFRPTDVLADADGSLLVVDTGGWYKLCCPSSQLAKADVLGAIYRVRKEGAAKVTAEERKTGYARLARPPGLRDDTAEVALKRAILKADPAEAARWRTVLHEHAPKASGSTESARLARLAAEGLGRVGDRAAVPLLFEAIEVAGRADRFLEHSLLYALIEIGAADEVRSKLASSHPLTKRAALMVLGQLESSKGGGLKVGEVLGSLNAPDPVLRDTAQWVARRHPEWGNELAGHFRGRLTAGDAAERTSWESLLGLLAHRPEGQAFLAEAVTEAKYRPETRTAALGAMSASGVKELPAAWRGAVVRGLGSAGTAPAAIRAVRALPFAKEGDPEIVAGLRKLAHWADLPAALRLEAMLALPPGSGVEDAAFGLVRAGLGAERPALERAAAANVLARLRATPSQLEGVLPLVGTAGPVELPKIVGAFAAVGDEALGRKLVASLKGSKALTSLRPEDVTTQLARFPVSVRDEVAAVLGSVRTDASQQRLRLDGMLAEVQALKGDIRRGQAIFNSPKAACSACHRLGYLGGDVGPDLTSIGQARTERDLLEAVVYPSASFVRSYEPWMASTQDGEEYHGVLRRDTPDEIVLATGPGAEMRIGRSELKDLRMGQLSTMPAGLDEQLSRQDLADLLSFLKNTKWGAN